MRISDWSSDVCSSDLLTFGQDPQKQEMDMAGMSWEELIDQLRPLGEMMRNRIPEQLRNDPHVAQESVRLLLYGLARASSDALIGGSEEHTSELQSLMRISYAGFCLKKKNTINT